LVVVCVGSGDLGCRSTLEQHGIDHTTVHIDEARPDLTKFDALVGDIAYNCMGLALEKSGDDVETEASSKEMDVDKCEDPVRAADNDFVVVD
jgi:hypothetical protein